MLVVVSRDKFTIILQPRAHSLCECVQVFVCGYNIVVKFMPCASEYMLLSFYTHVS